MGHHIINGKFKSDKYPWCPVGFFALKFSDPDARKALIMYAALTDDDELTNDLITACHNEDLLTEPIPKGE